MTNGHCSSSITEASSTNHSNLGLSNLVQPSLQVSRQIQLRSLHAASRSMSLFLLGDDDDDDEVMPPLDHRPSTSPEERLRRSLWALERAVEIVRDDTQTFEPLQ